MFSVSNSENRLEKHCEQNNFISEGQNVIQTLIFNMVLIPMDYLQIIIKN